MNKNIERFIVSIGRLLCDSLGIGSVIIAVDHRTRQPLFLGMHGMTEAQAIETMRYAADQSEQNVLAGKPNLF